MTTPPQIDPRTVKAEQREAWDAISTGWQTAREVFERGAATVTRRLLELGEVGPGHRVLDIATGLGDPALSAARLVGATGSVVGVDISNSMLSAARRRAAEAGLDTVDFMVGDVESIDLPAGSFDVALSRWGLMFAIDHVAAFSGVRRLLVPGGVLAAAVWGPPATAPMMSLGYRVLSDRLQLPAPPPGTPGPFSMSDPRRLVAELAEAGFVDVSVTELVVPFRVDSAWQYAEFNRAVSPPKLLALLRERYGTADDLATWEAVATAAGEYQNGDGKLSMPSITLCVRAVAAGV